MSAVVARWLLRAIVVFVCACGATVASAQAHAVDELVLDVSGATLRGAGWFAPAESDRPLEAIALVAPGFQRTVRVERVRRPDVVVALDRPELLESGWRFQLPVVGPAPSASLKLRFLDAGGAVLAESSPVPVVQAHADAGKLRHRVFAWTVAFLPLAVWLALQMRRGRAEALDSENAVERGDAPWRRSPAALASGSVLIGALLMATVVPPFQSPDEFDHVERAYALSQGRILLATPHANVGSGVWVNDGLLAYMALYEHLPFNAAARLGAEAQESAGMIGWQRTETFSGAPGTGYYLPVVYLPQALALGLGRATGASIDASYRAARLFAGIVAALLLYLAFLRWPPSMLMMALLLLPMTLFQWSGAGIDAVSIGATALALSLWLQQEAEGTPASARRIVAVGTLLVIVVGCRFHMAPLLLVPLWMARPFSLRRIALGLAPFAAIAAWTTTALEITLDPRTNSTSASDKLLAYAAEPGRLIDVAWTTATTPAITDFYGRSFVGVLGWLDTELPPPVYAAWGIVLGAALVWALAVADWRRARPGHALTASLGIASAALVPLLLLLMWTAFESPTIDGVQGRYFLLPALALAMAIPAPRGGQKGRLVTDVGSVFTLIVALYTLVVTLPAIVARYYG